MLTFIPQGGLCNRMRSVDAAMAVASDADTGLVVQWHKDPGLNCEFTNLFELPDIVTRIDTLDYNGVFAQLRKSARKRWYKFRFDDYFSEPELLRLINSGADIVKIVQEQSICAAACVRFYDKKPYYKDFRPVREIMDQVEELMPSSVDVVGIHIRRADHRVAIERSPLELFTNTMHNEVQKNKNVQFFLATDSADVEAQLSSLFPGRIIKHDKTCLDRGREGAIKDALIDLYCLSKAQKILGSYSSSFSEEAAVIGDTELITMDGRSSSR